MNVYNWACRDVWSSLIHHPGPDLHQAAPPRQRRINPEKAWTRRSCDRREGREEKEEKRGRGEREGREEGMRGNEREQKVMDNRKVALLKEF